MRGRRALLGLVAAAALTATAVAAGPGAATVDETAVRLDAPDRAVLISDSAWLGIHFYGTVDAMRGFDHTLALASCRRRVVRSCVNYDGFVPDTLVTTLRELGDAYSTLIVATGYNDGDRAFADEFRTIVGQARALGYRRIVWITLRSAGVTYESPGDVGFAAVFERNNATLRSLVEGGGYDDVTIADWASYARDRPEWFAPDGIHLRTTGTYAAADYTSRKMAFLDGRPCPAPFAADEPVADPCPDPDVVGPIVALEGIYPLDRAAPRPQFALEFVGHGSWPDPPWWERS